MTRLSRAAFTAVIVLWLAAPGTRLSGQQAARRDSLAPRDTVLHSLRDSLGRTPIRLLDLTVAATPARKDEPLASTTIPGVVLHRTPALDPWDLARQVAGLQVGLQGQGAGFAANASLRGFSSDHSTDMALYIDGVPNNEPINGHAEGYNDWNLLMPVVMRDLEVVRGPTSAQYGNFAMAGTVNVRTMERMRGWEGNLSGGSYGRFDASLLGGVDRDRTGGLVAVRYLREDGWRPNGQFDQGQFHARLVRQLSSATTLDLSLLGLAMGWAAPGVLTLEDYEAHQWDLVGDPTDGGTRRRAQERLSLRVLAGDNTLWRTTIYATQGRLELFLNEAPAGGIGEGSGSQREEGDQRHGYGLTSALTWTPGTAQLTGGVNARLDYAGYESYFTTSRTRDSTEFVTDARQSSAGLFAQSLLDLTPHLRMTLGARLDWLSTRSCPAGASDSVGDHEIFLPKLGLLYHIPGLGAVYANVSRGFRTTDGVIRDPSLPLIGAWNYEAGVKVDQPRFSAGATIFRVDVSNEQTFNPVDLTTTSGGRSRRRGLELDGTIRFTTAVHLTGNLTWLDARYLESVVVDEDGEEVDLAGLRIYNTARWFGAASIDAAPPEARWSARLGANFIAGYSPFEEPGVVVPGYVLLHAGGGWRIGRFELELGVRNLLDSAYPELRAGELVAPGQPRTVFGGVRTRW